ncbi:MAG: carboxypeptidase-like regulatory domain-containing protein, partial [Bacteroidales bacterium]
IGVSGAEPQQRVTLSLEGVSITQFFKEIEKRSDYKFFYTDSQIEKSSPISVNAQNEEIVSILDRVLSANGLTYQITGNQIVIELKGSQTKGVKVSGQVRDNKGEPLAGVAIFIPGTQRGTYSSENGTFQIEIPSQEYSTLSFRMVGMTHYDLILDNRDYYEVVMEEQKERLEDVVVTGIVEKRAESFTGAVSAISAKEIARVGNKNIIESLKNIDPSLYIMDNLVSGSNPNALPQMQMRGTTSFPAEESEIGVTLKGNYGTSPNTPLFIVDGFEASLERVMDMDMNRIEGVTILKDASAKALYGSKAANGIIVIETKRLQGSEQRINYTGSMDISLPDLTSYNLANAAEKL